MSIVRCWNCDAENDPVATSGVCALCGKRLGDRPVELPVGWGEHWSATLTLFLAAGVQVVCGTSAQGFAEERVDSTATLAFAYLVIGLGVVFAGLGVWSRFMPLTATIIGLVLYAGVALFDTVMELANSGPSTSSIAKAIASKLGPKYLVVMMLVYGVWAAVRYHHLTRKDRLQ
jgi:hypothetical protein